MTENREAIKSSTPIGEVAIKGGAESIVTRNLPVGGPSTDPEENNSLGEADGLQDEISSHESAGGDSDHLPAEGAADMSSTASATRVPIRLGGRDWTLVGTGVLLGLVLGLLLKRRN